MGVLPSVAIRVSTAKGKACPASSLICTATLAATAGRTGAKPRHAKAIAPPRRKLEQSIGTRKPKMCRALGLERFSIAMER